LVTDTVTSGVALGRNVGEVFGVFGVFQPQKGLLRINYLSNNSANFDGLSRLEDLIKQIGPPKWPWPIVSELAAEGKAIYDRPRAQGGCVECHENRPSKIRSQTWETPIQNVETDTRQYDVLGWKANSGVLTGAYIPKIGRLKDNDLALNILRISVVGSIAEHVLSFGGGPPAGQNAPGGEPEFRPSQLDGLLPPDLSDLEYAFNLPGGVAEVSKEGLNAPGGAIPPPRGSYEARVLQGIWATAPYLHNGSVPTLAELLKPAADRKDRFKLGPAYDKDTVGLATEQPQFNYELKTSDCSDLNSGNSRCGHEFGTTQLSDEEKRALLEYLKTL
jgi:hypothetical protein